MKVAVVGIQGDVIEHINVLNKTFNELEIKGEVIWARDKKELEQADGVTIPGGESTTIGKLMSVSGMDKVIGDMANKGIPLLGTCAGAILLSRFGLINIKVDRNAYGRQKDSFETQLSTPLGEIRGVFIRSPIIKSVLAGCKVFATHNKQIVGAEQKNILALTFHPELSEDTRIFQYFLKKVIERKNL